MYPWIGWKGEGSCEGVRRVGVKAEGKGTESKGGRARSGRELHLQRGRRGPRPSED